MSHYTPALRNKSASVGMPVLLPISFELLSGGLPGVHSFLLCKLCRSLCICSNTSICSRAGLTTPEPTLAVLNQNGMQLPLNDPFSYLQSWFSPAGSSLPHFFIDCWQFAFEVVSFSISRCFMIAWDARLGPVHLPKHAAASLPCCADLAAE